MLVIKSYVYAISAVTKHREIKGVRPGSGLFVGLLGGIEPSDGREGVA
jgi:hypothetical protein